MNDVQTARILGWASIGLGLTEMTLPRWLSRQLGFQGRRHYPAVFRILGLREIMQGVGILTQREPSQRLANGLWARVAGDVLDLAVLGAASRDSRRPAGIAAAAAMVLGIGAIDLGCARRLQQRQEPRRRRQADRARARDDLKASSLSRQPVGV